jgi:hypothetical protein
MITFLLNDGAALTAPSKSENDFWEAMRLSSKFDQSIDWSSYRTNFISRWELTTGQKWSAIWKDNDINTMINIGIIKSFS